MGWKRGWKKIVGARPARFKRVWIRTPERKRENKLYGRDGSIGPAVRFTWAEAACKDGTAVPAELRGAAAAQGRYLNELRKVIADEHDVTFADVLISVTSWYRTPAYNRLIGGAVDSQHMRGIATDITVRVNNKRLSPESVAALAEKVPAFRKGGIGWYDRRHGNFTHVDHRPNGPARWVNG